MILLVSYRYTGTALPDTVAASFEIQTPEGWSDWTDIERDEWVPYEALEHRDHTVGGPRPYWFQCGYNPAPQQSTLDKLPNQTEHR